MINDKKILFIARALPFPIEGGDSFVIAKETKALLKHSYAFDLLCYKRSKSDLKNINQAKQSLGFENIFFESIKSKFNLNDLKKWLFNDQSALFLRFSSCNFANKILQLIKSKKYSTIIFEHTYMYANVLFFPEVQTEIKKQKIKTIINTHVIEFRVLSDIIKHERINPIKNFILNKEHKTLKKHELISIRKATNSIFLSKEDCEQVIKYLPGYKSKFKILNIIPDTQNYQYSEPKNEQADSIYFIGTYSWVQNKNALKYFVKEIFPLIQKENPKVKLYIIGINASLSIRLLGLRKNIIFKGKVKNYLDEIKKYSILVIPLQIGGGTRIKLIEALACGKAVVATPKAIEGINIEQKTPAIIVNNNKDFAKETLTLLKDERKRIELKKKAKDFAENNFSLEKFQQDYTNIIKAADE